MEKAEISGCFLDKLKHLNLFLFHTRPSRLVFALAAYWFSFYLVSKSGYAGHYYDLTSFKDFAFPFSIYFVWHKRLDYPFAYFLEAMILTGLFLWVKRGGGWSFLLFFAPVFWFNNVIAAFFYRFFLQQ